MDDVKLIRTIGNLSANNIWDAAGCGAMLLEGVPKDAEVVVLVRVKSNHGVGCQLVQFANDKWHWEFEAFNAYRFEAPPKTVLQLRRQFMDEVKLAISRHTYNEERALNPTLDSELTGIVTSFMEQVTTARSASQS